MRLGKLGEQIVLKSENAFAGLEFLRSEEVKADNYYIRKRNRDREARREYRANKKNGTDIRERYIIDIMREGMKNGDARLQ